MRAIAGEEELEKPLGDLLEKIDTEIPYSNLIPYADLEVGSSLAKGGGGAIIFNATWRGRPVVFKTFVVDVKNDFGLAEFKKEAELMARANHHNFPRCFGHVFHVVENICRIGLVIEFFPDGDLEQYLFPL